MNTTETIYKSRSNDNAVLFFENLVAMDLSAITSITLKLYTIDGDLISTVNSTDSPSLIAQGTDTTVSPNTNNKITFALNGLDLIGTYYAQVIVYDALHPNGQTIAHPRSPDDQLIFNFVDA